MIDDPLVDQMLEELLESGGSPEEACRMCPELLPQVRTRLARLRRLEDQVGVLFPPSSDGQGALPTALPSAELPHIGGYEVLEVLGRGGMGVVYAARHLRLDRSVALKMLLAGPFAGPQELARFLREAQAVARLRHPNVVQLYDVGDVDGRPYFTMELIDGGSLARKLADGPLPAPQAAALVATVAEAIQAAHQSGIVHRDLKPANVLLTADGSPKVTDFGLARRLEHDGELTWSGVPIGTPSYMAPEQARGDNAAIGPATDVYSLGAILYESLTGRRPFQADTAAATLQQVLTNEPVPPARLNPRVPRDLETICLKCLQKDPPQRYDTAQAVADDLHRFERREPILARPLGRLGRLARWARRRPTAAALCLALLASLLLALALVGGGLWLSGQRLATALAAEQDLREADGLLQQADLTHARAALERARGRLEAGGAPDLRQRVAQAEVELRRREVEEEKTRSLTQRLEKIRMDRCIVAEGQFDPPQTDRQYEQALRSTGLGGFDEKPAIIAQRIKNSPARAEFVAALDDWANCADNKKRRDWLLAVARQADPDPWRDQVRDPAAFAHSAKLKELTRIAPTHGQSVQLLVALGERLFRVDGTAAIPFLRKVQFEHPNDFYANYWLALALLNNGDVAVSIGFFRMALALQPGAAVANFNLGRALSHENRASEALPYFQKAVKIDPRDVLSHGGLGEALRAVGRPHEAIDQYQEALRLDPKVVWVRNNLGIVLYQQGRLDEAIKQLQETVRTDSRFTQPHFNLAEALSKRGRTVEAVEECRAAIVADPNSVDAHGMLAKLLMQLGRVEEATVHIRRAVALVPKDNEVQKLLRTALIRQSRLEEARAAWRKAIDVDPREHDAWFGYAELCLFLDHEDDYRRNRRALLYRFGSSSDLTVCERTSRACLLLPGTKDEIGDAAFLANRAVAAGRKGREFAYPYCLFAQGLADYRLGRLDDAIKLMNGEARGAKWLGPSQSLIVAMALYRKGQQDQARKTLAAAVISYDWSASKAENHDAWITHVLRREAEALILFNLPAFLEGKYQPRDNDERLALLGVCQFKDRRAALAGLYAASFAADPKLADDLEAGHRYRAACAAALAGCGGGADGPTLSQAERTDLRQQARQWLRLDLVARTERLKAADPTERERLRKTLSNWRDDPALVGLREPAALNRLPPAERQECRDLWSDLESLLGPVQLAK